MLPISQILIGKNISMKRDESMQIKRIARGLFLSIIFLTTALADEARIVQLKHRSAAEVIPLIQPLIGPNDALTGTDYRLIIRTSEKNFTEIQKLLAQLDTARRQLRVAVKQTVAQNRDSSG